MQVRSSLTNCMISVSAVLILAATAARPAGAQQVERLTLPVAPQTVVGTTLEITVPTLPDMTRAIQLPTLVQIAAPILDNFACTIKLDDFVWARDENPQEPPEIRIMSRIIRTALSDVEAPELPEEVVEKGKEAGLAYADIGRLGDYTRQLVSVIPKAFEYSFGIYSGSRKVSGFYMNGYGYLFTIRWPIRSSRLISSFYTGGRDLVLQLRAQNEVLEQLLIERSDRLRRSSEAAGAGREEEEQPEEEEGQEELKRQREELARQIEAWKTEYENRLIEATKEVMATYGHTLHRAAPEESITFIFEQSDEDEDNITLTVKRGELGGPAEKERALGAIRISRGSAETNPALKSQIRIMAEIIDAAFEYEEEEQHVFVIERGAYFGGAARTQYIPGYGVIFRKNARMSPFAIVGEMFTPAEPDEARMEARAATRGRVYTQVLEEATEESRQKIEEHLEKLKEKTAEILATYGTTLTELKDDEWVGINYEVGSAVGLLQSGMSNFLVLARMSHIREAARQGEDAADWLLERLVTNERTEQ